jgi:hypothetical protein
VPSSLQGKKDNYDYKSADFFGGKQVTFKFQFYLKWMRSPQEKGNKVANNNSLTTQAVLEGTKKIKGALEST